MKILYDPLQHFHSGFHGPMIDFPTDNWSFIKGHMDYFFSEEMQSPMSKEVMMMGSFWGKGDVIFSPHTLITNSTPWVVDIEHADWFFMNDYLDIEEEKYIFGWKKKIAQKMLRSEWCKKILCRSNYAIKSIYELFDDDVIADKCVLFYPTQPLRALRLNREKKVNLGIVISSYANYHRKGGDLALKVFLSLKKKYDSLQMIYVGKLPPKTFLFDPAKLDGLVHIENLSHEKFVNVVLPKIDILLMPSRAETFGTVVLEAMSYGKAVVVNAGRHVYGISEIVIDGKNGFTVQLPVDNRPIHASAQKINIAEFIQKTDLLISNFELRGKLGYNARELFRKKLSIGNMNRILSSVFSSI